MDDIGIEEITDKLDILPFPFSLCGKKCAVKRMY
jgi:hypothetical protein